MSICQYVFASTKTICGKRVGAKAKYCAYHDEYMRRNAAARQPIVQLAESMTEHESLAFRDWIVESLETLGLDHENTCNLNTAHSHSADCSCGADELTEKIISALERLHPPAPGAEGGEHG